MKLVSFARVGSVGSTSSPAGRHLTGTLRYQYTPKIGFEVGVNAVGLRSS